MTRRGYPFRAPDDPGKCNAPMWTGYGGPAGRCGAPAWGEYIDGPKFRDGWTGEVRRRDGKFGGLVSGLACPRHGGPEETGPRVFQDGTTESGKPMWCAVWPDFENLQESPAAFHEHPWEAIRALERRPE